MTQSQTISALLAEGRADAVALAGPGCVPLCYGPLRDQVDRTVATLRRCGLGRGDRVALVLPNGALMASVFLSVAAGATAAPLNPAYRREEFDFYLEDLRARALIATEEDDTPALGAAQDLGISVLRLRPVPAEGGGRFDLEPESSGPRLRSGDSGPAGPEDVALVLHTSGTTSRPKIVPLSQRNLYASARNIINTLRLRPEDRCLNVMPLFHIHGLMACLTASLGAGGSVYCAPGFNALRFFSWLEDARPTWYSAVPTMHQAILARARRNPAALAGAELRLIRSSSSSLPPPVMAELEAAFDAPVIEAYAMTEAAHQMTSNPLPPGRRSPGSVGRAAGPEVAIMDTRGELLAPGAVGEIVIRGDNVTAGYENNPGANQQAFTRGWFRTGDQGVLDASGYLRITGRLKEIINRGGEKISPREVDDVLMDHPAIAQVVTFAMPHQRLGEDVAAAVVLKEGERATEAEIRAFAARRLADFKVPRRVVTVDEIPKGPTGKLRRIGLAEHLGLG